MVVKPPEELFSFRIYMKIMVYKTISGELISEKSQIEKIEETRKEVLSEINDIRWRKYKERKQIFGLEYGEYLPSEEFDLPSKDQFRIARENAEYAWGDALWKSIKSGDVSNLRSDTRLSSWEASGDSLPSFEYTTLYLGDDDYVYNHPKLTIKSHSGEDILSVELNKKLPENVSEFQLQVEKPENIELVYHYEGKFDTNESAQQSINNLKSTLDSERQTAYAVIAASNALDVVQVESSQNNPKFIELFETLGLYYEKLENVNGIDVFFVTKSERGKKRIHEYMEKPSQSIEDYIELLSYPKEITRFIENEQDKFSQEKYDRYPSEEFIVYLIEDDEISEGISRYVSLCPYRPPPTKKHARYSIQLGRQIDECIESICRLEDSLTKDDVIKSLNTERFISSDKPFKSVFPSDVWPVKTEDSKKLKQK
jgi:hypothetical protein